MQLEFSPEEQAFRAEIQTLLAKVPQELRDRNAAGKMNYPDDMIASCRILNENGLATAHWPVEWGGKDWSPIQHHILKEEMALAHVPELLAFNHSMIGPVIAQFGSQELKERFLAKTANVDIWWCQGFSEPEAGSDLASLKTKAVRDGDHYVINGQKTWTTLGQYADWIFVLARTNPDVKKQAGISMFLVELSTPGIEMRPIQLIDGGVEVNEVFFKDVRVPAEQMAGEENSGWTQAKFLLGNERVGIARVGETKVKLARAKKLAGETRTATGTLLEDPQFAARIASLENDLLALEVTQLRVVASSADGKPNPASSLLKLRGSQLQQETTELLADIAGPDSLPSSAIDATGPADIDVAEWAQRSVPQYLNFRKVSIYGGSNEVQRQIIDKAVLGL